MTLLLAVLAGWALSLLVLGLLGLGGRISVAADDPKLAPALPKFTLTKINSRLGPFSDYQEVANRPLMMAERRPVAIRAGPGADTADFDVQLTSVLITPTLQMAILTDNKGGASRRVRVGETAAGTSWVLSQLEPRRAIFDSPAGQRILELRVYDGIGGPPATPGTPLAEGVAATPDDANAPPPMVAPVATSIKPDAQQPAPEDDSGNPQPQPPPPVVQAQTQEQQIEAIRQRIEARRAQAQAEQAQEKPGQK